MKGLIGEIKEKISEVEKTDLDFNPSYASSLPELINLIDLYWASKFRDSDTDPSGYKKAFLNIVNNPTEISSKMIDIDTKDIRIIAEDGQSYYPAWLFEKDLKMWMKTQNFGKLLNKIVYNYPKYGHLVAKKTKDGVKLVPLQNLYLEPDAETIYDSEFIIEKHDYTHSQLKEMKDRWNNIDEVIKKADKPHIDVYEYLIDGEYSIVADVGDGIEMYSDELDAKDLYKEVKWDDIPGRWLGRGVVERLFEAQIAKNQVENLFRKGLMWTSKHIWQTRDTNIASNLLTDVDDGDLLIAQSEVNPVQMEERNLHAYREADSKWDNNIAQRTFAYDVIRGERTPAGTPLGSAVLQTKMAGGYFDLKREDLGLFLKEILLDWIIPSFKKTARKEHSLMVTEFGVDDLEKLRRLIAEVNQKDAVINFINKNKRIPNSNEVEAIKAIANKQAKKVKEIKIPAGVYDNIKYKIDVVITSEQIDMASRLTSLQTMLQIIGSNPTILNDPRTKKVFYKMIDLAGFNPTDFQIEEQEISLDSVAQEQLAQRGGSIAKVPPVALPQEITNQTTI